MLQTTHNAVALIKAWEGFEPSAYFDSAGIPTIGFGTIKFSSGEAVQLGDEITEDEAEQELFHYIRKELEPAMDRHFANAMMQPNQRDALASFLYNLGGDSSSWPTLKKLINGSAPDEEVADQWMKYHRAAGKPLTGLYRRRMAEVLVWFGLAWEQATNAVQNVQLGDNWREFAPSQEVQPEPFESEIFEEVAGGRGGDIKETVSPPAPPPIPPHYEEPEPMPAPKPVNRPTEPFQNYDPENAPKDIAFSKRVHGLFLVIMGWMTLGAEALAGLPFVAELAAMSPLQVTDWRIGLAILMAGLLLHWYGKVKARGPLK